VAFVFRKTPLIQYGLQVATCYPDETKDFPTNISSLLLDNYGILSSDMRKALVQNLVMLRNKDVITSIQHVFPFCFKVVQRLSAL